MNRLLSLIALLLVAQASQAAPTAIATLPLLNIEGTGTVKPNLMLLYDNSGSMASTFTPDYVDDTGSCRSRATLAGGSRGCRIGDPPYASAEFNKQYYNPRLRYVPPVKDTGLPFDSMDRTRTVDWTQVPADGFGINKTDLLGQGQTLANLVQGFPDLAWCDTGNANCVKNTLNYSYPSDTRYTPAYFLSNPYYYTINVGEYCTDATLTNCKVTQVGAPAPAGYPFAAPVRWCDSRALTNCQAKYVGNFKYPRFSDPNRIPDWYGSITIRASTAAHRARIKSVQAVTSEGSVTLTATEVFADNGTDTLARQAAAANALALSIVNKTNDGYTACVRTPSLAGVPSCSGYGISLASDTIVAVVPVACSGGTCTPVKDGSRAGVQLVVGADDTVTALLTVSGTAGPGNKRTELASLTLGSTVLFNTKIVFDANASASNVAKALANKIGVAGVVQAFVGGTSTAPPACRVAPDNTLCLVSTQLNRAGQTISMGTLTNPASLVFAQKPAVADAIPTSAVGLGASVFTRVDIVPTRNTYPRSDARQDCASATFCTYDEEMTNFANWYAYYKTRNQMMKTSVGLAFQPVGANYKVGIVSLSVAAAEGAMTGPQPFVGTARTNWYESLYKMNGSNATPLRQALHAVGKMYANLPPYKRAEGSEVVRFPCEQNFTFMTTDGYWNGPAAADVVSNDNVESATRFCSKESGCVDPSTQAGNSLADIALYWYNGGSNDKSTSLRPELENWAKDGLVPGKTGIDNKRLHMNTYTLGLGVDGIMTYEANYKSPKPGSDFHKLINGVQTGCPWNNNGPYVWPNPATGDDTGGATYQSRVDDLWHAAINGHGTYFSASAPLEVVDGLQKALSDIEEKEGAASAAATSTPNVSVDDNDLFAATFTTVKWYGELASKEIDPATGEVSKLPKWNTSNLLGAMVGPATDSRKILMRDVLTGQLKEFRFALMTPGEQAWFSGKCSMLDQCAKLDIPDRLIVNNGINIVDWLRGQQRHADDKLLRRYPRKSTAVEGVEGELPLVLGDIASSKPAYMRQPSKDYPDTIKEEDAIFSGYPAFKAAQAGRAATVFVGANDGMLHAFDGESGKELWAYVPRITMPKLYKQASTTYGTDHQFTVDGSPEVVDVKINGAWRTVLVGGLNAGGRGYYALDVTNPAAPASLWELCADRTVCANYHEDIGLTFGNPQIGVWKDDMEKEHWVAFLTSGYNNIPGTDGVNAGSGKGWLYVVDIATGAILSKTSTDGSTETPSGLARITAISNNPHTDPRVTHVYGGDNLGRMWRFDYTAKGDAKLLKMIETGAAQPITTRPDVTLCEAKDALGGTVLQRVVAFGTGRLLDQIDIKDANVQAAYVLADKGKALGSVPVATLVNQQLSVIADTQTAYAITGPKVNVGLGTVDGWTMRFDKNTGERVNLDTKIIDGALNMVTNMPTTPSGCKVGGTSNVYQVNVCTAEPLMTARVDSGGKTTWVSAAGTSLSSSAAAVGTTVISLPSGDLRQITTNADGSIISTPATSALPLQTKISGWRRIRE